MTIIRTIPEQTSFLGHFDVIGGHFSLLRIELFFKVHDIVQRIGHLIEFSAKKSPILFLYASINTCMHLQIFIIPGLYLVY